MENKATINRAHKSTKNTRSYRRESSFWREIALLGCDGLAHCTIRFYGRGPTVYCVAWIGSQTGCGKAGGYGYHKASAAMQEALNDAGVTLDSPIDGVGDSAMRRAVEAIASALGLGGKYIIHESHA